MKNYKSVKSAILRLKISLKSIDGVERTGNDIMIFLPKAITHFVKESMLFADLFSISIIITVQGYKTFANIGFTLRYQTFLLC